MKCNLCPRSCGIERSEKKGVCGVNDKIKLARAALHFWEEPCISGENGSGAVFFAGCPLKCVFCQNKKISQECIGKEITAERLAEIFLELQAKKAHNINLVTPTQFIPQLIEALGLAEKRGLDIPIIYNTGGYEKKESLKKLDKKIDVYLPDFKYISEETSGKYSNAPDYPQTVKAAISEMVKQRPEIEFDENGIIKSGVIVRHLVLPGYAEESKKIIEYLYKAYGNSIYLSIMNQYTPVNVQKYPEINRCVTKKEYESVIDYAIKIGVENAFIQEDGTAEESFIPEFNGEGV